MESLSRTFLADAAVQVSQAAAGAAEARVILVPLPNPSRLVRTEVGLQQLQARALPVSVHRWPNPENLGLQEPAGRAVP